jgi:hypothetical protein
MSTTTTPVAVAADAGENAVDITRVPAHLFKPSGKWEYDVTLDYTGLDLDHWNLGELAQQALANATANGTSGVIISDLGDYWTLVVIRPPGPYSFPVMVHGSRTARA